MQKQKCDRGNRQNKTKKKYVEVEPRKLVGTTLYLAFISQDIIYYQNMSKVLTKQFQEFVHKQLKDLNFLLHLKQKDFLNELINSPTLKNSLESCLNYFTRKKYSRFVTSHSYEKRQEDELFFQYSKLLQVVLKIYHRITHQVVNKEEFQLIYNQWLLDIPKILDILSIYGDSNAKIVKQIVKNMFELNRSYHCDFQDFLDIVQEVVIPQILRDLQILVVDLNNVRKDGYGDIKKSLLNTYLQVIFKVYDYFINLNNIYAHFPLQQYSDLVVDYGIQYKNLFIFLKLNHKIKNQWKLTAELTQQLKPIIQGIRQQIIRHFINNFNMLNQILTIKSSHLKDAITTLVSYAKIFIKKQTKQFSNDYETLLCIISENVDKMFPTAAQVNAFNIPNHQKQYLIQCQSMEIQMRRNRLLDSQCEKAIKKIPYFDDWMLKMESKDNSTCENIPDEHIMIPKKENIQIKTLGFSILYQDQPEQFMDEFPRIRLQNQWQDNCLAEKISSKKNNLSFDNTTDHTINETNLSLSYLYRQSEQSQINQLSNILNQISRDQQNSGQQQKSIGKQFEKQNNLSYIFINSQIQQTQGEGSYEY